MSANGVDWSGMTGEQVLAAILSAPVVMNPWRGWGGKSVDTIGSGTFFARSSDSRLCPLQGDVKMFSVQPDTGRDGWHWSGRINEFSRSFETAAEAIADADREMRSRGWVLIGETIRE